MNNIRTEDFIQTIKKRPKMFVGSETVSELQGLLRGYIYARSTLITLDEEESELLKNFSSWLIEEKFDIFKGLGLSWQSTLLVCYTSEKVAFDKFFELWDEFSLTTKGSD